MTLYIFWLFAALTAVGLTAYVLQVLAVRSCLGKPPDRTVTGSAAVSVLKPLRGLDDNLFDNLESFCNLDYPEYEVIFSLQDLNDPACKVARNVADRHPDRARVVIKKCIEGLNPKVNNLIPAYRAAKYDYILISDSNVSVGRDYLKEIMSCMRESGAGLVSNLIRGMGARSLGSVIENLHMNSFVMGSVCFLEKFLGLPCVVGKSMLMRKKDLESIGGLKGVKDVLAEDYLIGKKMADSGRKVVLSSYIINNVNRYWGVRKFLNRHSRWGKLRWKLGGGKYFFELLGNPVFISVFPLLVRGVFFNALALAAAAVSVKMAGDFYMGKKAGARMNPLCYMLVPLKDIVIGILWFVPILSSTIVWRGNRYVIGQDSRLSPYPETSGLGFRIVNAIRTRFA